MLTLIDPISEEAPCGEDIRYQPSYRKILDLRKSIKEGKSAEYKELERLCIASLSEESKDLHVLGVLIETWISLRGLDGAKEGLSIALQIVQKYWSDFFPKGESHEVRSGVFMWMNTRLSDAVLHTKITEGKLGYTLAQLIDARKFDEYLSKLGIEKQRVIDKAKAEGKPLLEDIQKAIQRSKNEFYIGLTLRTQQCLEVLKELEAFLEDKIIEEPVFFSDLINKIELIKVLAESKITQNEASEQSIVEPEEVEDQNDEKPLLEKCLELIDQSELEDIHKILVKCILRIDRMNLSTPLAKLLKMGMIWGSRDLLESFQILAKNNIDLNEILKITHLETD